ncbi:MAG: universal stress protein [Kiritimatiellae bacterium]|nr:universal stress protein [Kiritimatiellia bacterium]
MNTILVGIDFSPVQGRALDAATTLARAMDAELILIHVASAEPDFVGYEPGPEVVRESVAHLLRDHHRQLQDIESRLRSAGVRVRALMVQGGISDKIIEEAGKLNAGWIVLGSHGHGALRHALLGSVTQAVIKHTPCPVIIVPSPKSE